MIQFGHDGAMGISAQAWVIMYDDGIRRILKDVDGSLFTQINEEIRGPFKTEDDARMDLGLKEAVYTAMPYKPSQINNALITKDNPNAPIIQKSSGEAGTVTSTAKDMDAPFIPGAARVAMDKMTAIAVKPIEVVTGKKINTSNPAVRWAVAGVLGVGLFMIYKKVRKNA